MNKDKVKEIIDKHEQRQPYSCIPSAVEMILKLEGKVGTDFYHIQDNYTYQNGNSFNLFDGEIIENLKFRLLFSIKRDNNFPLNDLFQRIQDELDENRYVAISISDSYNNDGASGNFHNYIVYSSENNEFQSFSKNYKQTISCDLIKFWVKNMKGTDILVYKRLEDEE